MTPVGSAAYFNEVAEEYTSRYDAQTPDGYALRVRQQRVLELLDQSGGKALDVGCGPGRMVPDLLRLGYEFWGVDAAPAMIQQCEQQWGKNVRTHFAISDASKLEFDTGVFDCVICMGVIDRVENWQSALAEMIRVLKVDGVLVISFPNLISPYAWWKNFIFYPVVAAARPLYYKLARQPIPVSLYNRVNSGGRTWVTPLAHLQTERAVSQSIRGLGMQVTDVVYYNFTLLLPPLDEFFPQLSMRLSKALERLRFGKLKWLGTGFVIQALKRA